MLNVIVFIVVFRLVLFNISIGVLLFSFNSVGFRCCVVCCVMMCFMCVEFVKFIWCMVGCVIRCLIIWVVLVGVLVIMLIMLLFRLVFCSMVLISWCMFGYSFDVLSMMVLLYVSGIVSVCVFRIIGVFYGVMLSIMLYGWCMVIVKLFGIFEGMMLLLICVVMDVVLCSMLVVSMMLKLI